MTDNLKCKLCGIINAPSVSVGGCPCYCHKSTGGVCW